MIRGPKPWSCFLLSDRLDNIPHARIMIERPRDLVRDGHVPGLAWHTGDAGVAPIGRKGEEEWLSGVGNELKVSRQPRSW
jgi:hypothetical protein